MDIKTKILLPVIALTLLVTGGILVSNSILLSGFVEDSAADRVDSAAKVAANNLEVLQAEASAAALSLAGNEQFSEALVTTDRGALLALARETMGTTSLDFCTITDARGTVILRTHELELHGDSVLSQATITSALAGESLTVIESGTVVPLAVRAGTPVVNRQGAVVGAVSLGYRLDSEQFVDEIKHLTACEATVFLGDKRIATTILQDDTRAVGTKADAHFSVPVLAGNAYTGKANILGRAAVTRIIPLFGPGARAVGMLLVGQYVDETEKTIRAFVRSGLSIMGVLLAVAILGILLVVRRIVSPIHAMARAASALASGDTDIAVQVNTNDETRTLADAFNRMIENTRQQVRTIQQIADGDAVISLRERSEKDTVNSALKKLHATILTQAAAIREEHKRVKLMLDATPLSARLWNSRLELIDCNEAAVKTFHLTSKREYIDRYYELSPEYQPDGQATRAKGPAIVAEAFEKGEAFHEWMYRLPDGTPVPAELTMVRVPYGNDYVVASYSRDLREYKKMLAEIQRRDQQLQAVNQELETALASARDANNAKSNFLAQMSHEIRTPLNAVIGLSELILGSENLSPEVEADLEKIYSAGSTILSIVNDILDISKIEAGKFELHPVRYDTPSLINDTVMLNVMHIGERDIVFTLHVDENLPGTLYGDDLRVKQIFNNLLSNAFKFTASGTVEWRVSFERDADAVWLVSSVRDTGMGIKPEDMSKLFSAYSQVDGKTNRKIGGTGLGLPITKRLVEMLDGSITVESEYGKGTIFSVRLRQEAASGETIGKDVAANLMALRYTLSRRGKNTKLARTDLSYAHVLLVDDLATNLDVARGMMKPYALQIDCALSGPQAVEMIRAENPRYSAVFMDHMMPGMDGLEAVRIIRQEIGTDYARNIPIIALTANAVAGSKGMFLSHGFQDFLSKPIDVQRLDAALRRWVRDKKCEKELTGAYSAASTPCGENNAGGDEGIGKDGILIDGVEMQQALARFGGDASALHDVLRSYATNTRQLLKTLEEHLAADAITEYGIVIHGIKGASYGICANEAGKAAEALELAAQAGDAAAVTAGHSVFMALVEPLLDAVDSALAAIDAEAVKPFAAEPDPALLQDLREACAHFAMDGVDKAMTRLESFRYERGGELVAWLRERIKTMDFETIAGGDWMRDYGHENGICAETKPE